MVINTKIEPKEEIKFIGTYDISKPFLTQKIFGFPGLNFGLNTNIAGVCSDTFISVNLVITGTGIPGGPRYSDETYSMVSYPDSKEELPKLGSIIWSGTRRINISDSGITPPSVQEYAVTGTSGIYSNINKVIIDYNNVVRIIYFIGPKE